MTLCERALASDAKARATAINDACIENRPDARERRGRHVTLVCS
jgi:hypothetical protein